MCAVVCKQSGLWKPGKKKSKKGRAKISIAPLFETIDDLQHAKHTIKTLYANTHYQQYLLDNDNIQEIMVGYSDQIKDGGNFCEQLQSLPRHRRFNQTSK